MAVLKSDFNTLEGLSLLSYPALFTPQRVLEEIGAPPTIFIRTTGLLTGGLTAHSTFFYPEKGIAISLSLDSSLPIKTNEQGAYFTYCLNDPHYISFSDIVEPFTELSEDNLTMVQRNLLPYYIATNPREYPIETVSNSTAEQLAEQAKATPNVCVDIKCLEFYCEQ